MDKGRAVEKIISPAELLTGVRRAKYQVTIERPMGLSFKTRRCEETMAQAQLAALREFYALHPAAESEAVRLYCREVG